MQQSHQEGKKGRDSSWNYKKNSTQETKQKNNPPDGSTGGLPGWGKNRTICSIYLPLTDQVIEEDMRDLLEHLPVPMILLGDFNAHIVGK